ncbi:hypothetical protein KIL84_023053 [Mauremys mutica]|uniref:Uncharacterized protein n=1 Tax=Mauremys mutica TaxID=74926 RepID=A0A9D4APH0_9SAUR|nr:hypothetical protein KIL84_023053 [Mauremys mutica]
MSQDIRERSKYDGLKTKIASNAVLKDLGMMNDAHLECTELAEVYRRMIAHKLLLKQVDLFKAVEVQPGDYLFKAQKAAEDGVFQTVSIVEGGATRKKLFAPETDTELIASINVLDPVYWPTGEQSALHGEKEIKEICCQF